MQMFFFRNPTSNFGDDLNAWMWYQLSPDLLTVDESEVLVGIGTLLAADVPSRFPRCRRLYALGSGVGYAALPDVHSTPWADVTTRGPVSAQLLGLPESAIGTDAAILLAAIPGFDPLPESEREGVVFMPHHEARDKQNWRLVCERAGVTYLDPSLDSRALVLRIRRAKLVLADAMHAAIVADTMRVPWIPIASSKNISTTKWLDWTASLDLEYAAKTAPQVSVNARAMNRGIEFYDGSHLIHPARLDNPAIFERFESLGRSTRRSRFRSRGKKAAAIVSSKAYEAVRRPLFDQSDAVDFLRDVAREEPSLSTSSVFSDRLAFMQERLRALEGRPKL